MYSGKFFELFFFRFDNFPIVGELNGKRQHNNLCFLPTNSNGLYSKEVEASEACVSSQNYLVLQLNPELFAIVLYRNQENHFIFVKLKNRNG